MTHFRGLNMTENEWILTAKNESEASSVLLQLVK